MRVLFLVQGEGRGHLTQAVSLAQILQNSPHELVGAVVGVADGRPVPAFFAESFPAPIETVASPALVYSQTTNALLPFESFLGGMKNSPVFWRSLALIDAAITRSRADVVINFYEVLGGLTYYFRRPQTPLLTVAHQYLAFHPQFQFPADKKAIDKQTFMILSRITAFGAREKLALSFDELPDVPTQRLRVMPPLLRQEATNRQPTTGNYLLAYMTQPGLRVQLAEAHQNRPDVPVHCFNSGVVAADEVVDNTLTYHAIDGKRFLDFMQNSRAVITTAGFESVCEAAYLGKPVLMMPQPNHYEQACNGSDGQRAGIGITADSFDLNKLMDYLPQHDYAVNERFRAWQNKTAEKFLEAIERLGA
jgi:uncharacterized protein (TIGR00661 family)